METSTPRSSSVFTTISRGNLVPKCAWNSTARSPHERLLDPEFARYGAETGMPRLGFHPLPACLEPSRSHQRLLDISSYLKPPTFRDSGPQYVSYYRFQQGAISPRHEQVGRK